MELTVIVSAVAAYPFNYGQRRLVLFARSSSVYAYPRYSAVGREDSLSVLISVLKCQIRVGRLAKLRDSGLIVTLNPVQGVSVIPTFLLEHVGASR